ncbi:MAG: AMP-binding protein [Chloroflexi bacterium]|nr:AMP-binding protein [Chloroflexota bacterium]
MLVNDFLQDSAEQFPNKVALVCDGRRLTYTEIEEQANRIANSLLALGIERGDRVAIWMPNSVETVIAIFGILKAGATFTVVNATTKANKLAYVLNNCAARGLFAPDRRSAQVAQLFEDVPSLHLAVMCGKRATEAADAHLSATAFPQLLQAHPPTRPPCATIDIDLACLIYTSGSTGEPKGVMSTHANVVFAASSIIEYLENVPEDIVINVLPLAFDYGLYQLMMVFKFGGTLVLERSFTFPAAVLKRIAEEQVTGFPGVPTVFALMLQMNLGKFDLSSIRYLTNTAAALPVEHIRRLRDTFSWARLYSMYGLTECKRTLYLPPEELNHRPGSVGIAIPGTEVWVQGEDGQRMGPGEVGELVVRGSHVMQGYWNNPEATARWYRPGRYPAERILYTGDLFKTDEEGFLYFVARKDDVIKSRGEKVAPKEVESVLYQLPGVVEAAVIGVPDKILGEAIKAFIVCSDDQPLTEKDIRRHCTQNLEDYMVPKHIEFRESLPKTSSGKIQASALKTLEVSETSKV